VTQPASSKQFLRSFFSIVELEGIAKHLRGGHWDFQFCSFGYFLDWFFGFCTKDFCFSVLVFMAVCRFFAF